MIASHVSRLRPGDGVLLNARPGVRVLRIEEPTIFDTWIATKAGAPLSTFALTLIDHLRQEMETVRAAAKAHRQGPR